MTNDKWVVLRRVLLRTAIAAAVVGLVAVLRRGAGVPPPPAARRRGLLRPPGSVPEADFLARCIRCQRCSDACEAGAIRLFEDDGSRLAKTPHLIAEDRGCTLCLKCGPACPTGAIVPLARPADSRMGVAVVDERLCVSHNGTGICGACFTVCPRRGQAITQDLRNRPVVHADACVGCGLCEEACIVDGDRAIRVASDRAWP
jgi:MauM/NapG family ferredoxin protein